MRSAGRIPEDGLLPVRRLHWRGVADGNVATKHGTSELWMLSQGGFSSPGPHDWITSAKIIDFLKDVAHYHVSQALLG